MDYPFPASPLHPTPFRWTGRQFVATEGDGSQACNVLTYDQTPSNWSDDLTRLHEDEAGEKHPIDIASRRLALRSIRKWVTRPSPVLLDVGCSSGHLLKEMIATVPDALVIGADYIPELLERLAARMPGVPLLQFDLRRCPLPDDSIDAVTCLNVLEHIDDDALALRQIHRILRGGGGIAHIEVPAGPHLYDIYDEQLMHHRRYRLADLLQLAKSIGFEVLAATHLGFLVYPAFRAVKLKNRALLSKSAEEKRAIVSGQIRSTRQSLPLTMAIKLEAALGRMMRFPVGIRCVVVLRKA